MATARQFSQAEGLEAELFAVGAGPDENVGPKGGGGKLAAVCEMGGGSGWRIGVCRGQIVQRRRGCAGILGQKVTIRGHICPLNLLKHGRQEWRRDLPEECGGLIGRAAVTRYESGSNHPF